MKKRVILLMGTAGLMIVDKVQRQTNESLIEFNRRQQRTTQTGMLTLGSWAVGNFVVSGLSLRTYEGSGYYFHRMNLLWNVVNVTLAGLGYYQAVRKDLDSISLTQTVKDHHSLRRKLLLNIGLDTAYVVGGLYLLERAKNEPERPKRWRGYGRSLILQGAFLLTFDLALYLVVRSQAEALNSTIKKLTINSGRTGFIR